MSPRRIQVEIIGDSRSVERAFAKSSRAATGFSDTVGRSAKRVGVAVAAIGVAATAAAVGVSKTFSSFEESLSKVVGLAGGAREQVEEFGDAILDLGPDVGKRPQELADALFFVASAGIKVSEQLGVVDKAARASAAGMGETMVVADAITSVMNAYGSSVVDAARATDILVNTVRFGKGEAADFAPVIGNVAAIAAELGVSFEEVGAALAAQTKVGTAAEIAAIQLQAVFSSLLKVTPKAAKALGEVGLNAEGLREQLRTKGLLSVLETLKESFGDNTAAMAEAFPNIRALRSLLTLVGQNAAQTREVFDGMADSTGALGVAFEAVSQDEGFKFQKTMAALQATGIRLGAMLAPLASAVAGATADALGAFNDLLEAFSEAKTVRGKITVVFDVARETASRVTRALGDVVSDIDWDAIWSEARGVADGLQEQLEQTDWSAIGRTLGDAVADGVRLAVPAVKELGERITQAVRTIDFEGLGKEMGPGLAAAVVTGFTTLLDPSFWIRNWDLALAVALTALGGTVGRLFGKLAAIFGKLGADATLALAGAIEGAAPAVGRAVLSIFLRLPGLVARALAPLTNVVSRTFKRLGRVAQFAVKVLGIQAAINVVLDFGKKIGDALGAVAATVRNAFSSMFDFLKRKAIEVALDIIEPFTHIPGFLGGGVFQDLKRDWQGTLQEMERSTETSTKNIQGAIDKIEGRRVSIAIDITSTRPDDRAARPSEAGMSEQEIERQAQVAGERAVAQAESLERVAEEQQAAAARSARAAQSAAKAKAAAASATKNAAKAAETAAEKQREAFDDLFDALSLSVERATATRSFDDDLKALSALEAAVKKQIKVEGATTELLRQLFQVRQQREQALKDQATARRDARTERQFKALGLSGTGEDKLPGIRALRRQLLSIGSAVEGTFLDTGKTRTMLSSIRKVLGGGLGAVTDEVKQKVSDMLSDIDRQLKEFQGGGNRTKTKALDPDTILAGLGLDPDAVRRLRARLSGFNTAGVSLAGGGTGAFGVPIQVNVESRSYLDGQVVATSTTKYQQRSRRRNPPQKRGGGLGGV